MRLPFLALIPALLIAGATAGAQAPAAPPNPFAPPQATVHYAPDRDYDLVHVALTLNVDYPGRKFQGVVVNRISALRDGLQTIKLHCGRNLAVASCAVGSVAATFTRADDMLLITAPRPIAKGAVAAVTVRYSGGATKDHPGMMADAGLHWIEPNAHEPDHIGLWTQGESETNRQWVPTWDYPNSLATSETIVTVPADWTVIGNGALRSNRVSADGKKRTFHWQMEKPHATYLLSLVAGPFAVRMAKWRDVPLMYVAPRSKGKLLDYSFAHTPDMLSFYSDITGVKYAWPKYAQNAMYDFGGGMENVSATTLGETDLTDPREGDHDMDGINAHELAHQWFGDLVTCRDWSHVWLNESFATFFAALYSEHSRGATAYARDIDGCMRGYIGASRQYKRPLATNLYPNPDAMFDAHSYPKGAAVLHTLRRLLGDRPFFAGIHAYLELHKHTPVDSRDLCRSMSDATGVNLEPFWDQWVFKPGHPVLDTAWSWDEASRKVVLTVKQTQDTRDGTPVYSIRTSAGLIADGKLTRVPISLSQAEQVFKLDAPAKPDAVLLDPDHDVLREAPAPRWTPAEAIAIMRYASSPTDRADAMSLALAGEPSEAAIQAAVGAVIVDTGKDAVFDLTRLGELKRPALRPLFRAQLRHASENRREQAVHALALLPRTDEDAAAVSALVNDTEKYRVVTAAVAALAAWDFKANLATIMKAAGMPSRHEQVRAAAYAAMANAHSEEGLTLLLKAAGPENGPDARRSALDALGRTDAADLRAREVLRTALKDTDLWTVRTAVGAIGRRKDKELLPALRDLKAHPPAQAAGAAWFGGWIDGVIAELSKP